MRGRHRRVRESAARLAGQEPRVDPRPLEEALPQRGEVRAERAVGGEHPVPRLVPRHEPVVVARHRRVAVPMLELG